MTMEKATRELQRFQTLFPPLKVFLKISTDENFYVSILKWVKIHLFFTLENRKTWLKKLLSNFKDAILKFNKGRLTFSVIILKTKLQIYEC